MSQWAISLKGKVLKEFHLQEGDMLIIGRGDDANVRVDNPAISRHHAVLTMQGGQIIIEDLASLNGTKVNGRSIESCPITEADFVTLGKFTLRPYDAEEGKQALTSSSVPMDLEKGTMFVPVDDD